MKPDLVVIHEHPEWQKPLFEALDAARRVVRAVRFEAGGVQQRGNAGRTALLQSGQPQCLRPGQRPAVPLALAYMRTLERRGARVLNGADVFALELSKSAQATLLGTLGIDTPRSITFNDVEALAVRTRSRGRRCSSPIRAAAVREFRWWSRCARSSRFSRPTRVCGCRTTSSCCRSTAPRSRAGHRPAGVPGRRLLYAMRVKTHGRFNLCPSPVCNPDDGDGVCEVPAVRPSRRRRSSSIPTRRCRRMRSRRRRPSSAPPGWTSAASSTWKRRTAGACSTTSTPTRICGPSVAAAFGFDPFERVVDYLERQLALLPA